MMAKRYPGMKHKPKAKPKKEREMPIMREAIDKEDFDRKEKGLSPRPKKKIVMPDPEAPMVEKRMTIKDIPIEDLMSFTEEKKTVSNREGVKFIGFDVIIRLRDKKPLLGWMAEKDVLQLRQLVPRR